MLGGSCGYLGGVGFSQFTTALCLEALSLAMLELCLGWMI